MEKLIRQLAFYIIGKKRMKKKTIIAVCVSMAILAFALGIVQVVYAPVHWGGGRIDIKPAPADDPATIQPCPWAWGGGRIDTKLVPA